jgi:hypothetical protein
MGVYTDHGAPKRQRVITYIVLGGIFLVIAVIAIGTFRAAKESSAARDKATQLQQAFTAAGLRQINVDQVVLQLGNDGGIICAAAKNEPTARAQLANTLGTAAGSPGARPVGAAGLGAGTKLVTGLQQVIRIYCPEEMDEFVSFVNDLRLTEISSG